MPDHIFGGLSGSRWLAVLPMSEKKLQDLIVVSDELARIRSASTTWLSSRALQQRFRIIVLPVQRGKPPWYRITIGHLTTRSSRYHTASTHLESCMTSYRFTYYFATLLLVNHVSSNSCYPCHLSKRISYRLILCFIQNYASTMPSAQEALEKLNIPRRDTDVQMYRYGFCFWPHP